MAALCRPKRAKRPGPKEGPGRYGDDARPRAGECDTPRQQQDRTQAAVGVRTTCPTSPQVSRAR